MKKNKTLLQTNEYIRLEIGFQEWLAILGYAEVTVTNIPKYVCKFLHWLEQRGINKIHEVTPELVQEFFTLTSERKNIRSGNALSSNYLNKYLQSFRLFSTYLRETEQGGFYCDIQSFPVRQQIKDILTIEEVALLYENIADTPFGLRDRAMLGLYYGCGLRRNEGVHIDIDDILFDRRLLYVRSGKNFTERYVPIHSTVLKDFSDYLQNGRVELNKNKNTSNAFLISERADRIDGQSLILRLKKIIENTGNTKLMNKQIGLHSLRHSIATHLLLQGMKLERIGQFLGHKSIESTQIYAHVAAEYNKQ